MVLDRLKTSGRTSDDPCIEGDIRTPQLDFLWNCPGFPQSLRFK